VTVLWPRVQDRLVTVLPAVLVGAKVYGGPVVAGEKPARYLTVGCQPSTDGQSAGTYEQAQTLDGYAAQESGTVLMELAAVTGSTTLPDAFESASAISAWVQADQTLGVMTPGSTSSLSVEVLQAQNKAGAVQRLLLTLNYFTRLERTP
jgi:hypothetical protein